MKQIRWLFCLCLFVCPVVLAQEAPTYGEWQRTEAVDPLTMKVRVGYHFVQQQPDGRSPYVFVLCSDGQIEDGGMGYFTDSWLYFDANLENGIGDRNFFSVEVRFRGANGKIRRTMESVRVSDSRRMTLSGGELGAFGKTGELILQFPNESGHLVTDVFRQQGISIELKQMMEAECYSPKRKPR